MGANLNTSKIWVDTIPAGQVISPTGFILSPVDSALSSIVNGRYSILQNPITLNVDFKKIKNGLTINIDNMAVLYGNAGQKIDTFNNVSAIASNQVNLVDLPRTMNIPKNSFNQDYSTALVRTVSTLNGNRVINTTGFTVIVTVYSSTKTVKIRADGYNAFNKNSFNGLGFIPAGNSVYPIIESITAY